MILAEAALQPKDTVYPLEQENKKEETEGVSVHINCWNNRGLQFDTKRDIPLEKIIWVVLKTYMQSNAGVQMDNLKICIALLLGRIYVYIIVRYRLLLT